MGNRSRSVEALILGLSAFGEGHKNARLFVVDSEGSRLVDAAFFGGSKSRMRGLIMPYHSGRVWLYSNPVTGLHKITDFSVSVYRTAIREDLTRSWCAGIAAELVLRLHGTVDWHLVLAFLDGINKCPPNDVKPALIRFLWRVVYMAGVAPHIGVCGRCENLMPPSITRYYLPHEDYCICHACSTANERTFMLHGSSCEYLQAVIDAPPQQSRKIPVSENMYTELKRLLFFLITSMVGSKLKTLDSCAGIL